MALTDKLAELDAGIVAAGRRVRDVDLEVRAAKAKAEEAKNMVIEAHAEGDDTKAAKRRKTLEAAEEGAKRLREEKFIGVQRAQERAEADRLRFVANHYEALLDERRPAAEKVARAVEGALTALVEAHADWRAVEAEVITLMRLAGKGHERTPAFPAQLAALVRDVGRFGGSTVPAPVPGGQHRVRIHPTTHYG